MLGINLLQQQMNIFLLIDTATPVCSVALSKGQEIIYSKSETQAQGGHAARLGVLVEEALAVMRTEGLNLSAVGISAGPGSYTGLRIGSSLAKGLCHGYGIPLIAISTLQTMAIGYRKWARVEDSHARLIPMIDARRQEVYTATFDSEAQRLSPDTARVVSGEILFDEEMNGGYTYHFFGDGINKPQGITSGECVLATDFPHSAEYLLPAVEQSFSRGEFVDVAYWTPNYLKDYIVTVAQNKVLGS